MTPAQRATATLEFYQSLYDAAQRKQQFATHDDTLTDLLADCMELAEQSKTDTPSCVWALERAELIHNERA